LIKDLAQDLAEASKALSGTNVSLQAVIELAKPLCKKDLRGSQFLIMLSLSLIVKEFPKVSLKEVVDQLQGQITDETQFINLLVERVASFPETPSVEECRDRLLLALFDLGSKVRDKIDLAQRFLEIQQKYHLSDTSLVVQKCVNILVTEYETNQNRDMSNIYIWAKGKQKRLDCPLPESIEARISLTELPSAAISSAVSVSKLRDCVNAVEQKKRTYGELKQRIQEVNAKQLAGRPSNSR